MDHNHVIIRKPWGYEYMVYKNEYVALWLLHIQAGHKTSLHCHPNKSTGLAILQGTAEINFIADSDILTAPAKKMIRRGLFHQTHALNSDVLMFEIETPVDKNDLLRLQDPYGRTDNAYEGIPFELPKTEDCLWLENPSSNEIIERTIGTVTLTVLNAQNLTILDSLLDDDLIMFMQGGLIKSIEGRKHMATKPGDIGFYKVVKQVAREMDGFDNNTVIMIIRSSNNGRVIQ